MDIKQLLHHVITIGASDLHLSSGLAPLVRVDGEIISTQFKEMNSETMQALLVSMINAEQQQKLNDRLELDFTYDVENLARFRVNIFYQNNGLSAAFRAIPNKILTLDELQLPPILAKLCQLSKGLILVTGATGSGKSTTLAAMLDYINNHFSKHILTIEDPIEFIHASKKSLVQQREVYRDTQSFNHALRAALREDPDIILIGELRDLDTIRLALTAAETGHLVFATLHTSSAAKTIDRLVEVFAPQEKEMIRHLLSESLQAVFAQTLVKKKQGGRIAIQDILVATPAIRHLIRENKIAQIYSSQQSGANHGMITSEQHSKQLIQQGIIDACSVNIT